MNDDEGAVMTVPPHSDALVFFGASGDLAYKQIFPALQALVRRGTLNAPVVGTRCCLTSDCSATRCGATPACSGARTPSRSNGASSLRVEAR